MVSINRFMVIKMLETIIYDGLVLLILFTIFVFQFLIASFVVYSFIEAIYPKEKGKMLLYMFIADLFLLSALLITYGILNLLITYGI